MRRLFLLFGLLAPALAQAQNYSIDWFKIAGGGGISSGTNGSTIYTVSGTIGQQDAGTAMTGGNFSLTGGFWSLFALVQLNGSPVLTISLTNNTAVVSWPYPSTGFVLQTNNNLANSNHWANFTGATNVIGGSNSVSVTPRAGDLFFRLAP